MKNIIIKNAMAFAACQLAQSSDKTRKYLTGVCLYPSGRVAGTNGHYAVYHDEAIEPFEGGPIILAAKPLSVTQCNRGTAEIRFDQYFSGFEATIVWRDGIEGARNIGRQVMAAEIIEAKFPNIDGIIPSFKNKEGVTSIDFNASYVAAISKRLDKYTSQVHMKISSSLEAVEVTFPSIEGQGIKMILMPIRA